MAACLPSAVRVDFGRCAIVRFLLATRAAFLMFHFAARLCFIVAMAVSLSLVSAGHFTLTSARGRDNTSNLYLASYTASEHLDGDLAAPSACRCLPLVSGSLMDWPTAAIQVDDRVYERDVRERLGEITDHLSRPHVIFFG